MSLKILEPLSVQTPADNPKGVLFAFSITSLIVLNVLVLLGMASLSLIGKNYFSKYVSEKAKNLAQRFVNNFEKFTDTDNGKALVAAGPQL